MGRDSNGSEQDIFRAREFSSVDAPADFDHGAAVIHVPPLDCQQLPKPDASEDRESQNHFFAISNAIERGFNLLSGHHALNISAGYARRVQRARRIRLDDLP